MQTSYDVPVASTDFATRALRMMQYLVGLLMAATVVLLVWQHFGMERVFELSSTSGNIYEAHFDASSGGKSTASIERKNNRLKLNCDLVKAIDYPSCSIWFAIGKEPKGIDLSEFDFMTLDLAYQGPGEHMVKIYLRNFDHGRSVVEQWQTQRMNEVEVAIPASGMLRIPLSLVRTADWWAKNAKIPLEESAARLDNVISVELSTGTYNTPGGHQMDVGSVRFHGKWISQNRLLMILVGLWFTCGIIWPLLRGIQLRTELAKREARLSMLSAINQALELETRELTGQAYSDPLTGALNRQGLRDALVKQWQSPSPLAETASVIFMDLDHFKKINDVHGHPVGDEVLRRFAAMVQEEIRATDKLVRWGGEEFLIICPATTAYQAQMLAEKLRLGMRAQLWPCRLDVTASFGVTALQPGEDIGEGIKRADEALYKAKANGRDRVEVLPELPSALLRPLRAELIN